MNVESHLPSAAKMLAWIEGIVAQGIRRPGYPADRWAEAFITERFREFGLESVRCEPVLLPGWKVEHAALRAWPEGRPAESVELSCFPLPHTGSGTVEAQLVSLEQASGGSNGVVFDHLELVQLPQAFVRGLATRTHDPDGEFDELVQVLPFGARLQDVLEPALEAGAAAFVGGLTGVPWETCDYYVPYDGVLRDIPAVWVSAASARVLATLLDAGPVTAVVSVRASRDEVETYNVIGELRGPTDEWVVIGTHHDGPWASAVEDGTGIAMLLAQAQAWAAVPASERPHNLMFAAMAGHMVAGAGTAAFIADHPDLLERIVLELHLEHAAAACEANGRDLVPTDAPEPRWWFTTQHDDLVDAVHQAIVAEDLRRSFVLPPDVFGATPPTDGGYFHGAGVPLVNFLTAPMYLFDSADTIDKVHVPSLEPVSRAAAHIVAWTGGRTAAELRTVAAP
jgi:hypothetical protein